MFTAEEFKARTNWKMSYAEYVACCCTRCSREKCPHRDAFRRVGFGCRAFGFGRALGDRGRAFRFGPGRRSGFGLGSFRFGRGSGLGVLAAAAHDDIGLDLRALHSALLLSGEMAAQAGRVLHGHGTGRALGRQAKLTQSAQHVFGLHVELSGEIFYLNFFFRHVYPPYQGCRQPYRAFRV